MTTGALQINSNMCTNESLLRGVCYGMPVCGFCYDFGQFYRPSREYEIFNMAVIGVIMPSLGLMGLVGNAVSAFIYSRRCMRSSLNVYLCALAFSDITIVSTSFFLFFLENMRKRSIHASTYYALLAPIMFPLGLTAQTLSVFLTLAGAFDCFMLVVMRRACCTMRTLKRVIVCIVISACCFNLPHIFEITVVSCWSVPYKMPGYDVCPTALRLNETYYKWYYAYLYTIVMAAGPVFVLVVLNVSIIIYMRRKYVGISITASTKTRKKSAPLPLTTICHQKNALTACRSVPYNFCYKPRRIRSSEFSPLRIISTSSQRIRNGSATVSNLHIQSNTPLLTNGQDVKVDANTLYNISLQPKCHLAERQPVTVIHSTNESQNFHSLKNSPAKKSSIVNSRLSLNDGYSPVLKHKFTNLQKAASPKSVHELQTFTPATHNGYCSIEDTITNVHERQRENKSKLDLINSPSPDANGAGDTVGEDATDVTTLVLVVCLFISCNILPLTLNFLELLFNLVNSYLIDLSNLMVVLNSSCNFLIYYAFCESFRMTLHKHLRKLRARISGKCFAKICPEFQHYISIPRTQDIGTKLRCGIGTFGTLCLTNVMPPKNSGNYLLCAKPILPVSFCNNF